MSFKHPVFQCPDMSPSPSVPTSGLSAPRRRLQIAATTPFNTHRLFPLTPVELVKAADIKVIAALGDSLTVISGSFLPQST